MGAAAIERGQRIPAYFDNNGKLTLVAPTSELKANGEVQSEAAHSSGFIPDWAEIDGHIIQIPRTGLVGYLSRHPMLDENTYGDESSPRSVDNLLGSYLPQSPLRQKYMEAYLAVLGRG